MNERAREGEDERKWGRETEFTSNNNNKIIVVVVVVVVAVVFMINESDYRFYKMLTILPLRRTRFAFLLFNTTRKNDVDCDFQRKALWSLFCRDFEDGCRWWVHSLEGGWCRSSVIYTYTQHTSTHREHRMGSHTNLISFRGENANSMEIVTLSSEQWMCNATFSSYYFASVFIHLFFRFCFCAVMTFSSGRTHTLTLTCVFGYEFRYLMKFWVW